VAGAGAGRVADLGAAAPREHGDGDCPVCGRSGALTGQWRQATEQEVAQLGEEAPAAEAAERAGADARRRAVALLQPPPPMLSEEPPIGLDPGPAWTAWLSWAAPPDVGAVSAAAGLRGLADHLDQGLPPLAREVRALSDHDNRLAEAIRQLRLSRHDPRGVSPAGSVPGSAFFRPACRQARSWRDGAAASALRCRPP
jgi:hypothetical protein